MLFSRHKTKMIAPAKALPGREQAAFKPPERHAVLGTPLEPPFPEGLRTAVFGLGCFWGAERKFWQIDGVYATAVGYAGGFTPNPTYGEVCSGRTGHTEAVLVVFDPEKVSYRDLLRVFWEAHDPTQGMRQGNDVGTQYRSAIYFTGEEQRRTAEEIRDTYEEALRHLVWAGPLANFTPGHQDVYVNFRNEDRAPLLFIAGGEDNLMPPAVNESNVKHYRHTKSITDYHEFPGRSHFTVGQEGWEEVADYALEWAEANATRPAA
jgi:peptide-methionine (S)-S-oxide reductase